MTLDEMNLSSDQLHTLRHMLGINTPWDKVPKPYRNYAAVDPGDKEFVELEQAGAVELCQKPMPGSPYNYFRCTESGRTAAIRSHREIRNKQSSRRYRKFLDLRDCLPDLTFREFLTHPDFKSAREEA